MAFYIDAALYIWQLFQLWLHTIFVTPFQITASCGVLYPEGNKLMEERKGVMNKRKLVVRQKVRVMNKRK